MYFVSSTEMRKHNKALINVNERETCVAKFVLNILENSLYLNSKIV